MLTSKSIMNYESEPIIPWNRIDSKMLERAAEKGVTVARVKHDPESKKVYLTSTTLEDNDAILDVFDADHEQLNLGLHTLIDNES